jgi:hypothetical protein
MRSPSQGLEGLHEEVIPDRGFFKNRYHLFFQLKISNVRLGT